MSIDGARVAPGLEVCSADAVPPRPLAPGESYAYTYRWFGHANSRATLLTPGHYFLRGSVRVVEQGILKGPAVTIQINE